MNLYRVLDVKAELFGRIFQERTHESAKRAFAAACADPQAPFSIAPHDYVLYHVGEEDDLAGDVQGCHPVAIWTGREARPDDLRPVDLEVDQDEHRHREQLAVGN